MTNFRRFPLVIAVLLSVFTACSSDKSVGSGVNINAKGGANAGLRDVVTTTTAPAVNTTVRPTATTRAVVTTTTRPVPESIIKIQDDEQGAYFEPKVLQVLRGHKVTWRNVGVKQARKVVADDGTFVSPDIPVGGSWSWIANRNGTFNYKDATRPYTFGTVQVYG